MFSCHSWALSGFRGSLMKSQEISWASKRRVTGPRMIVIAFSSVVKIVSVRQTARKPPIISIYRHYRWTFTKWIICQSLWLLQPFDKFEHLKHSEHKLLRQPSGRFRSVKNMIQINFIIVVIITWTTEKPSQKNNSDITNIWVSDWFKWLNLFKISSVMSEFSTNKRT